MKTVIIGNSGSGKTRLANHLSAGSDVPIIHLNSIYWQPGGFDKKRSRSEVEKLIADSLQLPSWIVEGVFGELAANYVDQADWLLWLDIDWPTCRDRLLTRGSESKRQMDREQSEKGLHELSSGRRIITTARTRAQGVGTKLCLTAFAEIAAG